MRGGKDKRRSINDDDALYSWYKSVGQLPLDNNLNLIIMLKMKRPGRDDAFTDAVRAWLRIKDGRQLPSDKSLN
jgi:hypothetical protein